MDNVISQIMERLDQGRLTRFLAFGSSNTERRLPGMHWFDWLDLAIQQRYGRIHRCINTGIGGNTAGQLLERFEQDAAFYKPHAVIITIGGNDSSPDKGISPDEFTQNLRRLYQQFDAMGTLVIFQTYYSATSDGSLRFQQFDDYMQIIREIAAETGAGLVDHFARWEPLRKERPDLYLPMMDDAMHVNHRGNLVMGLDLARAFGLTLQADDLCIAEGLSAQLAMDELAA